MNFNKHFDLRGKHALLSASSWRWMNDDEESFVKRLCSQYATTVGTILHEVACKHIKHRVKMNKYDKKNVLLELMDNGIPGIVIDSLDFDSMFDNLMAYVNDGIGFKMEPEVILYYSPNCFGTADTISYSERDRVLRIHDYKSGQTPAHMEQLLIYAALFCMEYRIKVHDLEMVELRIYQKNEIVYHNPEPIEILSTIDKITAKDEFVTTIKEEV